MAVLVTGSIGIDTVTTPFGKSESCIGGSAIYFSMAASFFGPVRLVGAVGDDSSFFQSRQQRRDGTRRQASIAEQSFLYLGDGCLFTVPQHFEQIHLKVGEIPVCVISGWHAASWIQRHM